MDEIRRHLESELSHTMNRIRQMGGAVVFEEFPSAVGDNTPLADEVDVIRTVQTNVVVLVPGMGDDMLVERANKLAEALQRLRGGEYGLCEECEEPIAPARLRAMPEVTTCVRCQDRIERSSRRLQPVGAGFGGDEPEDD